MNVIIGLALLVLVGWITVTLLPVLLPVIGLAIVGLVVLMLFGAIFGKK